MAERRMFAKSIVLSDAFIDMPATARCLYFTLSMMADDDGFVGGPKAIMRQIGASEDDLKILLAKRYVLGFDSGVIVIKHWRINNYLQSDRLKPTTYLEEKATLTLDDKKAYTEKDKCIQGVYTQHSIAENNIDEIRVEENRVEDNNCLLEKKDGLTKAEVQEYILASGRKVNVNELWEKTNGLTEYKGEPIRDWKRLVDKWAETDIAVPF